MIENRITLVIRLLSSDVRVSSTTSVIADDFNCAASSIMEGFDTMTMSYYADPLSLNNGTAAEYLNSISAIDMDHHSNFDTETFVG